ncbi:MAG: hypothetical protein M3R17_09480 [Bacteroidota bacterium]|nr:hypothetical protein [Bacteroidota bacterium]
MDHTLNVLLAEDRAEDKEFFTRGSDTLNLPHKISWSKDATMLFEILEKER